jgi:ELWxxDGT repeat protein
MHHRNFQKALHILIVLLAVLVPLAPTRLAIAQSTTPLLNPGAGDPQPVLLKDIYTADASSNPYKFFDFGSQFFFTASDLEHGNELWVSDGSAVGTHLVADIVPGNVGSAPTYLTRFNDRLFFVAKGDAHAYNSALWMSDGTEAGTGIVFNTSNSSLEELAVIGNWLYFGSYNGKMNRYGGTNNTVESFTTGLNSIGTDLVALNGKLYFPATSGSDEELWSFDPVTKQASIVKDICSNICDGYSPGSFPQDLTVVGNTLYFTALDADHGRELWASDGSTAGTRLLADIYPGATNSWPYNLTPAGNWLYFSAQDPVHGCELWRSDGTPANTSLVTDLAPGTMSGWLDPYPPSTIAVLDNTGSLSVLFAGRDAAPGSGHGVELWSVPVTAPGTTASPTLLEIAPGAASSFPENMVTVGNSVYFSAQDTPGDLELWKTDSGSSSPTRVKDLVPGVDGSAPQWLAGWNGKLVFNAVDAVNGRELWISDGTTDGTGLVGNLATGVDQYGSDPSKGIVANVGGTNIRYFTARDALHGWELWRSDGTSAGTTMVKDLAPGYLSGVYTFEENNAAVVNGILYFSASDPDYGDSLWRTDGTSSGTWLVKDTKPGEMETEFRQFTTVGNQLFFLHVSAGQGEELWVSNGTASGTKALKVIEPGAGWGSYSDQLAALGNLLIFSHNIGPGSDQALPYSFQLWRSDGTSAGTQSLLGPYSTEYHCGNLLTNALFGGKLYFSMCDPKQPDHGPQLWLTDGTTAGTKRISAAGRTYIYSDPRFLNQAGSSLYFTARAHDLNGGLNIPGLWKLTPGTTTTSMVGIFGWLAPIDMQTLNSNTLLYLGRDENSYDYEWNTVNTDNASIEQVCEPYSGCMPMTIDEQEHVPWHRQMYFAGTDGDVNNLWVTDGTAAGTSRVLDPSTGLDFANPRSFLSASTSFFFTAEDDRYGQEPWVMHIEMNNHLYLPSVRK